jgi:serine/threonine protein kinase
MVLFYRRRRRRRSSSSEGGPKERLLLPIDSSGQPTPGITGADVAKRRLWLAREAQYEDVTRFPTNEAAKELAVLTWDGSASAESPLASLPFAELQKATQNFDASSSLGDGGSCGVFKGCVFAEISGGGLHVAVKRLNADASDWNQQQFAAEMELLSRISHPNVVRLFAFSVDGPQRCLVLQLCAGGALNDRLRATVPEPLLWQQRVRITLHILLALEYLHSLTPQMIHRQESYSRPCTNTNFHPPILSPTETSRPRMCFWTRQATRKWPTSAPCERASCRAQARKSLTL